MLRKTGPFAEIFFFEGVVYTTRQGGCVWRTTFGAACSLLVVVVAMVAVMCVSLMLLSSVPPRVN